MSLIVFWNDSFGKKIMINSADDIKERNISQHTKSYLGLYFDGLLFFSVVFSLCSPSRKMKMRL